MSNLRFLSNFFAFLLCKFDKKGEIDAGTKPNFWMRKMWRWFWKIQEGKYKCRFCGFVKEIQTSTSAEILSLLNEAGRLRRNGDFDEALEIY